MLKHTTIVVTTISALSSVASAALILSDNFNTGAATASLDSFNAGITGTRQAGLAFPTSWTSKRALQNINTDAVVNTVNGSNLGRFFLDRNLASEPTGSTILADGGLSIEFDYRKPAALSDTNWFAFDIGFTGTQANTDPAAQRIVNATTDFGILFRFNGGYQSFDGGTAIGNGVAGTYTPATGSAFNHITLNFGFTSFADGSNVDVTAFIDGTQIDLNDVQPGLGHTFTWDNNAGELYMEFEGNRAGSTLDNVQINTVPEPTVSGLLALAGLAAGTLRRRRNR